MTWDLPLLKAGQTWINRVPDWAWASLCFVFAFAYCLFHGRIGLNSLDSSIIFDGGYRILAGQDYLVDYYAPSGYIPSRIQSLFFQLLGVNWFAYGLHAAVLNGIFALLAFRLLRHFKAPPLLAISYAILSGLILYPPFGTPYPEQHAFFFAFLAVYGLVVARKRSGWKQKLAWMGVGPALALAFFSKQVPSSYAILLVLVLLPFTLNKTTWKPALAYLTGGSILIMLLLALDLEIWQWDWSRSWHYFWEMPWEIGRLRMEHQPPTTFRVVPSLMNRPFKVFAKYNDPYIISTYGLPALLLVGGVLKRYVNRPWTQWLTFPRKEFWLMTGLAYGLTLVSSLFIRLTLNQEENGIPYLFLHLGLVHLALLLYFRSRAQAMPSHQKWWRGASLLLTLVLVIFLTKDVLHFHNEVILSRKVHDVPPDQELTYNPPTGLAGLEWLDWQEAWRYSDRQMDPLMAHLKEQDKPFFYFGDMSFLYGLMDQPSPIPSLWLHHGLTIPQSESPYFQEFEDLFLKNLQSLNPGILISESEDIHCYMKVFVKDFPKVNQWLEARKGRAYQIGLYYLWELDQRSSGPA